MGSMLTLAKGLKPSVSIGVLVSWNALCGIGMYLNGGSGFIRTAPAAWMMVCACASLATFALATALSESWRRAVLREGADVDGVVSIMRFIALVAAFLAVGSVTMAMKLST